MRRHGAVVHDGTPETVEEDLRVMPGWARRSLIRQLAEGERIVIRTRQNPAVLARDALWPAGALVLWWWLVVDVKAAPALINVVEIVFWIGALRLGWLEVQRRFRWFVATNKRILKHEGVLTRSVPMMRLTKVTDMTYHRSALGEILGYGTIVIESAGQQQAIRDLTFVPDPDHVSAALNSEIFGEKPRTKKSGGGRSWPRIAPTRRRRRDDDDGPDDGSGGGPPRGRGPGPRDNDPSGADGGVDVSPSGHPPPPRVQPETWYRSSNLGAPRRLGDTGEIPVVHAAEGDRAGPDPYDSGDEDPQAVREIPLYPPRDWVDRR